MASYGKNMKWTVSSDHKDELRKALETGLGVKRKPGDGPVDIYPFPNDSWVGIEYVPSKDALTSEQLRKAPWLEFLVDDAEEIAQRLRKCGAQPVEYRDKAHHYFQLPGGPVFRLATEA